MNVNNEESVLDQEKEDSLRSVVSTRCSFFTRARSKHKIKQRVLSYIKSNRIIRSASTRLSIKKEKDGPIDVVINECRLSNSNIKKSVSVPSFGISNDICSSVDSKDPRFQIHRSLSDRHTFGDRSTKDIHDEFEVFSVWRPTSNEAIQKMMKGEGTGKGLDVKGKSAKMGKLSGLIPFVQIHEEEHKKKIRWPPKGGTIRIYFKSEAARNKAAFELDTVSNEMKAAVSAAKEIITENSGADDEQYETALENLILDVEDPRVYRLNETIPSFFGIDVAERIFFRTFISMQNIERCTDYETGRPSEPLFQDLNFQCMRKYKGKGPRAVVLQNSEAVHDALKPQSLIVAYEENGSVIPVASDFDCFLVGTRNVDYESSLSEDQANIMKWLLAKIETILSCKNTSKSWTSSWLDVLKENADTGFSPDIPEYGFGDPKSYAIMKNVANDMKSSGAVRHGAECFNYLFPQELDDEYLVISEDMDSNGEAPWKYVDVKGLQDLLSKRIEKGFTFPLNPKWILVDHGWKAVYDKMMSSKNENIQKSLAVWYPLDSGIRELIEDIYMRFPDGSRKFETVASDVTYKREGTEAMDLAEQELRRHLILKRAKFKLRCALILMKQAKVGSNLN